MNISFQISYHEFITYLLLLLLTKNLKRITKITLWSFIICKFYITFFWFLKQVFWFLRREFLRFSRLIILTLRIHYFTLSVPEQSLIILFIDWQKFRMFVIEMFFDVSLYAKFATFSTHFINNYFLTCLWINWLKLSFLTEFYLKTPHLIFLWLIVSTMFKFSSSKNQKLIWF